MLQSGLNVNADVWDDGCVQLLATLEVLCVKWLFRPLTAQLTSGTVSS